MWPMPSSLCLHYTKNRRSIHCTAIGAYFLQRNYMQFLHFYTIKKYSIYTAGKECLKFRVFQTDALKIWSSFFDSASIPLGLPHLRMRRSVPLLSRVQLTTVGNAHYPGSLARRSWHTKTEDWNPSLTNRLFKHRLNGHQKGSNLEDTAIFNCYSLIR